MYDNQTARSDKREQRKTLATLRQMKWSNNFIDQLDLIQCGIQAVKYIVKHPEILTNLMAGQNRRTGYDDDYLIRYGCAPGSQILMTENAFMTEGCWERMNPKLVQGYCLLPYFKENPGWCCLEVFDRFGPHYSSLNATKHRYDNKVLSAKKRVIHHPLIR